MRAPLGLPSSPRAFTLIELLIVVAIIAVLTGALGAPVLRTIRMNRVVDQESARMAALSLTLYSLTRDLPHGTLVELPTAGDGFLLAQPPGETTVSYRWESGRILRERNDETQVLMDNVAAASATSEGRLLTLSLGTGAPGMGMPGQQVAWTFALDSEPGPLPEVEQTHD